MWHRVWPSIFEVHSPGQYLPIWKSRVNFLGLMPRARTGKTVREVYDEFVVIACEIESGIWIINSCQDSYPGFNLARGSDIFKFGRDTCVSRITLSATERSTFNCFNYDASKVAICLLQISLTCRKSIRMDGSIVECLALLVQTGFYLKLSWL
jgi:hypothetical protein